MSFLYLYIKIYKISLIGKLQPNVQMQGPKIPLFFKTFAMTSRAELPFLPQFVFIASYCIELLAVIIFYLPQYVLHHFVVSFFCPEVLLNHHVAKRGFYLVQPCCD